jgi:hypothetical protein
VWASVTRWNLATSGATAPLVATEQLSETGTGPIDIASLIVGVNDTMRSTFEPGQIRDCLNGCAEQLTARGALLLTVRFHDHGQVFGLPAWLRRPLWRRIEQVNTIYDDLFSRFIAGWPGPSRANWHASASASTYRPILTATRTRRRPNGRTRSGWSARASRGWAAGPTTSLRGP